MGGIMMSITMPVWRETFAARLVRAFTLADYDALFADSHQMSLFTPPIASIRTVLVKAEGRGAHG
jgi:hypothetical protein